MPLGSRRTAMPSSARCWGAPWEGAHCEATKRGKEPFALNAGDLRLAVATPRWAGIHSGGRRCSQCAMADSAATGARRELQQICDAHLSSAMFSGRGPGSCHALRSYENTHCGLKRQGPAAGDRSTSGTACSTQGKTSEMVGVELTGTQGFPIGSLAGTHFTSHNLAVRNAVEDSGG